MNFLHVSDLHIGKKLCKKPLAEDQRVILAQITAMAARNDVDAVLIAGDLCDRSQPSGEAVDMAGSFLSDLSALGKPCFVISGNHDSAEQVAYCADVLEKAGIHVSPVFDAVPERYVLRDGCGEIHVYMLPFVRPAQVKRVFPARADEICSYADALRVVIEEMHIDPSARNVLLAHQFVTAGEMKLSDSETLMVGGVDAVPAELFGDFDYVALGHLHSPQKAGFEHIRYAGSPLKYSASEEKQSKAALLVKLGEKGSTPVIERLPYEPLHDVKCLGGTLDAFMESTVRDHDYVFVTLTDEQPPLDPLGALLQLFPNLVQYRMANSLAGSEEFMEVGDVDARSPLEHFADFFMMQNGAELSADQRALMEKIILETEEELHASH